MVSIARSNKRKEGDGNNGNVSSSLKSSSIHSANASRNSFGMRNSCVKQTKPNASRKEMRSFHLSQKNLRAAGQSRVLDLGYYAEAGEEKENEEGTAVTMNGSGGDGSSKPKDFLHTAAATTGTTEKMKMYLQTTELRARTNAESRVCCVFCYDGIAAILVILKHLITIESAVSTVLSTVATWILYNHHADWEARSGNSNGNGNGNGGSSEKPESYGKSMSFLILSFFLVMPITTLLRITYQRRENNLQHISELKFCAMAIYQCHATWMWKYKDDSEKRLNRLNHSDECLQLLIDFADTMTRFLTLPITGYPRHRETGSGRREEEITIAAAYALFETTVGEYGTKLGLLTERMKEYGFSPSEASRTRQNERMLLEAAEYLREGKLYRTPQSINALITFFAIFGPAFYAPPFSQIGYEFGSVWFGIAYAATVSLSITALHEAVKLMEDPFVCHITIDGVDVYEELSIVCYLQLLRARNTIFPNAPAFGGSPSSVAPPNDCATTPPLSSNLIVVEDETTKEGNEHREPSMMTVAAVAGTTRPYQRRSASSASTLAAGQRRPNNNRRKSTRFSMVVADDSMLCCEPNDIEAAASISEEGEKGIADFLYLHCYDGLKQETKSSF